MRSRPETPNQRIKNESLVCSTDRYSHRAGVDCCGDTRASGGAFMRSTSNGTQKWPLRSEREIGMGVSPKPLRCHAVAMDFAAYLDEHYVELRVRTATGKTIIVVCDKDSIFSIQRHIEQLGRACPEISSWRTSKDIDDLHGDNRRSYEAALWEGWSISQHQQHIP